MEIDFAAILIQGFVTVGKLVNVQIHALRIYYIKKGQNIMLLQLLSFMLSMLVMSQKLRHRRSRI